MTRVIQGEFLDTWSWECLLTLGSPFLVYSIIFFFMNFLVYSIVLGCSNTFILARLILCLCGDTHNTTLHCHK